MPPKQKAPPARAAPPPSLQRAASASAAVGKGGKKQQPQPQQPQLKEEEEEEEEEDDEDGDGEDSGNETESDDEDDYDDEGGDDDDEDEDEEDGDGDSVLDVDFTFSDPRPIDYKSVRRLLERYLPGEEGSFPVGSLADDVIGQRVVGTMVKVSDDGLDDAYAFSTILPLARYASKDWFKALKAFILKRAGPKAGPPLEAALANLGSLGLLLNERIYNMPPELSPAIHDSVLQDVAWAMQQAPGDLRAAFQDLTHVLVMAPCWLEKEGGEEAPAKGGKGQGQGQGQGEEGVPPGFLSHFLRFEERLWAEEAMVQVAFPVASPAEEQVAAAPTGSGSGSGSGAGAMPVQGDKGGRKRKGGKGKREEGEEDGEGEDGKAPTDSLRAPQMRRILLVPMAALQKAATAMTKEVEEAKRQRALELAAPPPAAPAAAAASAAAGIKKRKV